MIVYNFLVRAYGFIIGIASLKNNKATQWVNGRRHWRKIVSAKLANVSGKVIWVHCASYGEFEQGRPLIEAIKAQHPDYSIVLSFFSPSGYEAFKNWEGAGVVCYLPLDTKRNARDFIELVKPQLVIFIKYEFWVNFLFQLKQKQIPTFLVSAVFKPHHPFFKWYGGIFRRSLKAFDKLFIQDAASGKLLSSIGITNYEVCGDTRFDRVLDIKNSFKPIAFFETFCKDKKVIVAGSTWPKDEELLVEAFLKLNRSDTKLVLVPHNVNKKSIDAIVQLLEKNKLAYTLYSGGRAEADVPVLIVDAMGLLSKLYHYATVAYIGGGFNSGIHNCLEPAVYFKPLAFYGGDDYHKYNEAVDLLNMGAAINAGTVAGLKATFEKLFSDEQLRRNIHNKLLAYFAANANSTGRVLSQITF